MKTTLVLMMITTVTAGCAPVLFVTYHSDPEGAMLYANSNKQLFGYAPFTLKYRATRLFVSGRECMKLQGALVRWASGAEASIAELMACPGDGRNQQFVFVRPDVDGRDIDAQFAMQMLQNAALTQQAIAAEYAARAPLRSAPQNCRSQVIGNQIFTNCY